MKRLYILTLCSICTAVCIFFLKKRNPTTIAAGEGLIVPKSWLMANDTPLTPKADIRPADQTFLTFPEWFLVFSPDEQAQYFRNHTATTFPFMAHTAQIWDSYKIVNNQIKDNFPTNTGYHFMIWVIGSSATIEYSIKAWYETVIGRITDTKKPLSEEDKFNADFTKSYVNFILDRPWYEYDFKTRLRELWSEVPLMGNHFIRKIERRYLLTSELLVKYLYGKLIGIGTKQVYDTAVPTTAVVLEDDSLKYLPRYNKFASEATKLAKERHEFKEIAGNNSAILLTAIVKSDNNTTFDNAVRLFTQPVASDVTRKRIALVTPVSHLHQLLLQLDKEHIHIEHIFDY